VYILGIYCTLILLRKKELLLRTLEYHTKCVYILGIYCTFTIKVNTFPAKSFFHTAYIQRNQLDAQFLVNVFQESQSDLLMRLFSSICYC
jgi:hypothetical protein